MHAPSAAAQISKGLIALCTVACGPGDSPPGMTVRDSAGITIVENDHTQPAWTAERAWRLSADPTLTIGGVSGDSSELLHYVAQATRLADGTVAVVNSGSREVRFYDAGGTFEGAIGGDGDGPGEFRSPWAVHEMAGDSLLVIDLYREISIFTPDRAFVRRFAPVRPDGSSGGEGFEPVGQYGDGSLLFRSHLPLPREGQGLYRSQIRMVRTLTDGSIGATLGPFDDQTMLRGDGPQYIFGPWAKEAAADTTMWYGPGDRLELSEITHDGSIVRVVRLDRPPRRITAEDVRSFTEPILERYAGTPREPLMRRLYEEAEHPDFYPAHFELLTDASGRLWAQDYQPFRLRIDREWTVFDRDGRYLGEVTMPAGFTPHEIGDDYVLGVWRDELDVEYVHEYAIEKPRG